MKENQKKYQRIIIKIGSRLLSLDKGGLNKAFVNKIAKQISDLHKEGVQVVIVSSGAISAGMNELGWKERPKSVPDRQALAAIGQSKLMHLYEEIFQKYELQVAQVLLTEEDLKNRHRYLNARNTLLRLLEMGIIPIINENDTVAVDELKIGDNDTLSARVASKVEADVLILLTNVDGLYTQNPDKKKGGEIIPVVEKITEEIETMADGVTNVFGTGGMITKIQAAKVAVNSGVTLFIVNGAIQNIINRIYQGENIGTKFISQQNRKLSSRERWIAFGSGNSNNRIVIDDGAKKALVEKGKSLLPSGIVKIEGDFQPGDVVQILDTQKNEIARGLVNYNSEEVNKIKGLKSSQIESALGYKGYDEVVHRDNLVLME